MAKRKQKASDTEKGKSKASPRKSPAPKTKTSSSNSSSSHEAIRKLSVKADRTDRELLALLNERAALAAEISKLRESLPQSKSSSAANDHDAASHDALAIDELLKKNEGPLSDEVVRSVFRELTSGCRQVARTTRVGFLGPMYSYSYLAALERFGSAADLVPLGSIATVFEEVESQNVDYGIVPLENSTDGRVSDTLKMFSRVPVRVSGEVNLKIHHNLLAKGPRGKIRRICSKPQALSQCRSWLAEHLPSAELVETSSTTAAAEMASKDKTIAAVASRQAGVQYGLDTLAANIEDNKNNVTRFAVLGQESGPKTSNDKTALLFQILHQPGALADILAIFKRGKLNLTWIESFPLHEKNNEYFFFAELQGHEKDLKVRRAVAAVEKKTFILKVLGSYAATNIVD